MISIVADFFSKTRAILPLSYGPLCGPFPKPMPCSPGSGSNRGPNRAAAKLCHRTECEEKPGDESGRCAQETRPKPLVSGASVAGYVVKRETGNDCRMFFVILFVQSKYCPHSVKNGVVCPVIGGSVVFRIHIPFADASISFAFCKRYRDRSILVISGTYPHPFPVNIVIEW